jgi:hypothetical protein
VARFDNKFAQASKRKAQPSLKMGALKPHSLRGHVGTLASIFAGRSFLKFWTAPKKSAGLTSGQRRLNSGDGAEGSSTKEMNVIKATSLALALAVLIGNAASAQPPDFKAMRDRFEARWDRSEARFKAMRDRFEARMDQKYDILRKRAEGEYQRNIAEADKLRAEADKIRDAENSRLGKIYVECRASSATEAQTVACIALRAGK